MKRNFRKPLETQETNDGQAMVEFALTIPLFLAILFGFIIFAMLFYSYLTVSLASREGAGLLVRDPKTTVNDIQNRVRSTSISLDPSSLTIRVEPSNTAHWLPGVKINVTASYTVPVPIISIPNLRGPATRVFGPIPVTSTSVMTIE
jgi:Flp pilus assembly protein TadG